MDGNGRWAKKHGRLRAMGHRSAVTAVRDVIEGAVEIGIPYLTLFAFSTENWRRPGAEVDALMHLLVSTIRKELKTLQDNHIRLFAIGDIAGLPPVCYRELTAAMDATRANTRMTLTLALNYGGRADVVRATQSIARSAAAGELKPEEITETLFSTKLYTHDLPEPELLIRTSGEYRISNFLLWEIAYTELYITSILWPDFRRTDLFDAIIDFQKRERRFGKTGEQLHTK